jgi:FixJ family two-component response regulator
MSGIDLQGRIAGEYPHVSTVFLSANGDIATTVKAMKAGAVEFLTKPFRDGELLSAVREALDRSRRILSREAEKRACQKCYASLSCRERQVMALVASGLLNKEVGGELGISEITVKSHRGQVMRKMQAASLADLVRMAMKLGLAKRLDSPILRKNADRAANMAGRLFGSYTLAPERRVAFAE